MKTADRSFPPRRKFRVMFKVSYEVPVDLEIAFPYETDIEKLAKRQLSERFVELQSRAQNVSIEPVSMEEEPTHEDR